MNDIATLDTKCSIVTNIKDHGYIFEPDFLVRRYSLLVDRMSGRMALAGDDLMPRDLQEDERIRIGRIAECHIRVSAKEHDAGHYMSRVQGELWHGREGKKLRWFYQNKSKNGTFVNGEHVRETIEIAASKVWLKTGLLRDRKTYAVQLALDLGQAF
jgi:hypothetical protein